MNYRIIILSSAQRELDKLPRDIRDRTLAHIYLLEQNPRPHGVIKMQGTDAYRIRVGDYRVIFSIDDGVKIVAVLRVAHRSDVYR